MKSGPLAPLYASSQTVQFSNNSIAETTGISVWVFIAVFVAIVIGIRN